MASSWAIVRSRLRLAAAPLAVGLLSLLMASTGQLGPELAVFFGVIVVLTVGHLLISGIRPVPSWLAWMANVIPGLSVYVEAQRQLAEMGAVVDLLLDTLHAYRLPRPDARTAQRWRESLPERDQPEARLEQGARQTARWLGEQDWKIEPNLLILLYHERHGLPQAPLWPGRKAEFARPLAELLERSGVLFPDAGVPDTPRLPLSAADLARLVETMDRYSLDEARAEVRRLADLWQWVNGYGELLATHSLVAVVPDVTAGQVLNWTGGRDLGTLEPAELRRETLLSAARALLNPHLPTDPADLAESFALVSLAVYLTAAPDIRQAVCRRAADLPLAVRLVFAWLDFRADLDAVGQLDGLDFVSLDYLRREWLARIKRFEAELEKGFAKELRVIRDMLQEGRWPPAELDFVGKVFARVREESRVQQPLAELSLRRTGVLATLRRVFGQLSPHTIERYLETRAINAYLLTFRAKGGSVAKLVNCLVSPFKEDELRRLGVAVREDGQRLYNFEQYTPSARIGVIPKGMSFEDFFARLERDVSKVFAARQSLIPQKGKVVNPPEPGEWDWKNKDLDSIEVIVHRFGISGRNYLGVKTKWTEPHAIVAIRGLLAQNLDAVELITLLEYEERLDILVAVADAPVAELVAGAVVVEAGQTRPLLDDKESQFVRQQDGPLRAALRSVFGLSGETGAWLELGRRQLDQRLDPVAVGAACGAIQASLAKDLPQLNAQRCQQLVSVYLETLADLAVVDGGGRGKPPS